jgi:lipopolysaccharide transport system permease protein
MSYTAPLATRLSLSPTSGNRLLYLRDLLRELVLRDMKLRYKGALSGVVWSLFNPLTQLLVFSFVFSKAVPVKIAHYPSFVFVGLLVWTWFQTSLYVGTETFTRNRDLVRRPGFWSGILPVVRVTADLVHFLFAVPLLGVFVLVSGCTWGPSLLLLPVIIALQYALTLGAVYLVATMHVTFRDTQHLLGVFLMLAFYLTPVFYNTTAVPAAYRALYDLNPVAHLLSAYRAILLEGAWPSWASLGIITVAAALLLLVGFSAYERSSRYFADEL